MGHFKPTESATIAHGIVKPSKSFSIFTGIALVVGIFFLALKRFTKTEDQSPLFVVLAAAFLLTAVFLFLYTKRFQITYDEIFGWKKNFTLVQRIFLPSCRIMCIPEKLDGL